MVAPELSAIPLPTQGIPAWQRWNDCGIGRMLKSENGSERNELAEATQPLEASCDERV